MSRTATRAQQAAAARAATAAMQTVFGGSRDAYTHAQYEGGLAYLAATYSRVMAEHLETCPRFWVWWRLVWAGRDELWEQYCRHNGLCLPALITASYQQFHTLNLPYYNGFLNPDARIAHG